MNIQPINTSQYMGNLSEPNKVLRDGVNDAAAGTTTAGKATNPANTAAGVKPPSPADKAGTVEGEALSDALSRVREFVQPINDSIQFTLDEDTGRTVVKVVDVQTQQILRQIPSEEMLQIAKALDKLQGLLIQNKA